MTVPAVVSAKWLNDHLDNPNLILFDATQKKNINGEITAHKGLWIKGAIAFDIKNKFSNTTSPFPNTLLDATAFEEACQKIGVQKSSIIVVYDKLGIFSSPRVWWMFKTMGHQQVAVLNGGLPEWIKQGYKTVKTEEKPLLKGDFKAEFNPRKVKNTANIKENITTENALVVDVRAANRFHSLVLESRKGLRSGNIPKSINMPYSLLLENGKFKPESKIRSVLSVLNTKKSLVFSCGSGITACIVYLACDMYLNNDLAVYDGSWTEWGTVVE